jgi:hypothetical protein
MGGGRWAVGGGASQASSGQVVKCQDQSLSCVAVVDVVMDVVVCTTRRGESS